jgi:hypothetical protein
MRAARAGLIVLTALVLPGWVTAEEPDPRAVDYARDIKPVLSKHCYACHGALQHKAGLRLDTAALMRKGGDSGPAVLPGQSRESLIVDAVTGRDGWRMPPEGVGLPLSASEIAKLEAWIEQGAKSPAGEAAQPDPRGHWAFQAPRRPEVPSAGMLGPEAHWARNPIDALLAEEHRKHGLTPRPAGLPATLVRRVTLDLTGLVPSRETLRAFLADPSDRAYEALVDQLLASPQYGERWGRHWMDVWRYSDWDGFGAEVRESQPHIWRWRDWIVRSLNQDLPYNRMIVAMLAADEAAPLDADSLCATGFLVRNWYKFNRNVWLDDTVEHTAKAFLGITLNCAKCHDHKYDPIPQTDYYAFRAFFEPYTVRTDRVPGEPDTTRAGLVRVFDGDAATPTFLFQRGDEKHPLKEKPLAPSLPQMLQLQVRLGPIRAVSLPAGAFYPGSTAFIREEAIARANHAIQAHSAGLSAAETALGDARDAASTEKAQSDVALAKKRLKAARADLAAVEAKIAADTARYVRPSVAEAATLIRIASRLDRKRTLLEAEAALLTAAIADHEARSAALKQPADAQSKAAAKVAQDRLGTAREAALAARKSLNDDTPGYSPLTPIYPETSTGRRLALARWITDPANPLTARVAINQIWMRHFGTPLVPTVFDFGRNGTPPVIPDLLDWLALRLEDEGWRMKPIHRLIVTSTAYRMQSVADGPNDPNLSRDPANNFYWRMNPRRMEAEAVRDNLLYAAGNLDQALGGPDIDPETGMKSPRRSLYFRHAKEKRVGFLRLFDSPSALACYRRSESVMPQQALALANSSLCLEQARLLATTIARELPRPPSPASDESFISAAFERVLGRPPTPEERTACEEYLTAQSRRLADRSSLTPFAAAGLAAAVPAAALPGQRARENLVHVLFNHNDFITIR